MNKFFIVIIIAIIVACGYFLLKRVPELTASVSQASTSELTIMGLISQSSAKKTLVAEEVAITIDVSKNAGEMPYLFRSGIWLQDRGNYEYILPKFFRDNATGKVQMEISNEISSSKDFNDFKQAMKKKYSKGTPFRNAIEETKKSWQTLIIGQWPGKMPQWLSSRAGDDTKSGTKIRLNSPPKCYDYKCVKMEEITCYTQECVDITKKQLSTDGYVIGWAGIIDYTLRYFRETLNVNNLGYYFGHEQNKDWMGKEKEFYKTYEFTLKAAKAIDKNILVGGAGPWDWHTSRLKCNFANYTGNELSICKNTPEWSMSNEPMNKNFIKYVKDNGLQIDFINWHSLGTNPLLFQKQAKEMRSWLKDNGFNENTTLYPADWTVWFNAYPADYIDTEYSSAGIINSIYYMDKAGIQWHGHDFNVLDYGDLEKAVIEKRGKDAQFIGSWPIFTQDQIIKPSYNAFKALSILYGKKEDKFSNKINVEYEHEDDFITSIASQTQDKSKTRILLSNFAPDGNMLISYFVSRFQESPSMQSTKPYLDEINSCVQAEIIQCVNNVLATISDLAIKERVKTQVELIKCFKFNKEKIRCIQDVYAKTADRQTKEDIDSLKFEYQKILEYQKTPRQVSLKINGFPFSGKAKLTIYAIDKNHSNSCRYNKKTEKTPTNTECGINGVVDKATAWTKQEAKKKALTETADYLKEKGYTNKQIENFKNQVIIPCLEQANVSLCVQKTLALVCQKYPNINCEKLKQDLPDAYAKYQEIYNTLLYYGKYNNLSISTWIDKINNDKNVSLEGSRQTKTIEIKNGNYQEAIKLEPYGIKLIEIMKDLALD